jgi:hypothetical protein
VSRNVYILVGAWYYTRRSYVFYLDERLYKRAVQQTWFQWKRWLLRSIERIPFFQKTTILHDNATRSSGILAPFIYPKTTIGAAYKDVTL